MFLRHEFVRLRTHRSRRGGALIAAWMIFWLSQSYAFCCGPQFGRLDRITGSVAEFHAVAIPAHIECGTPTQTPCPLALDQAVPLALDQAVPLASAQPALFGGVNLAQSAPLPSPMFVVQRRIGLDQKPDSPGPPGRVYLRLQRLLI